MPSDRRPIFADSRLACAACACLLLLGCASLRSANRAALPDAAPSRGPLNNTESQTAIQRIEAVRDQAQCDQAISLWQQGRIADSRQLLSQVLARNPDQPLARRLLADLALESGNVPEAERLLVELLGDHPDDQAARAALAWLYESQDRAQESQQLFKQLDEDFSPEA